MAAVSAKGSTVCVLILHSSCSRSIAFVVRTLAPLVWWQTRDDEEAVAGFLSATARYRSRHLRMKAWRPPFDFFARCRVDHIL
jgi:hypothetical protein